MKPLVVFYSRTGMTRKVARAIADILKCDAEEVVDTVNRSGRAGYMAAAMDAARGKFTAIRDLENDPSEYDIIILGTPVWSLTASVPIRSYISQNKARFKRVAFFCTMDRSGSKRAFAEMAKLCEKEPLAMLEITSNEVEIEAHVPKVKDFVEEIKMMI